MSSRSIASARDGDASAHQVRQCHCSDDARDVARCAQRDNLEHATGGRALIIKRSRRSAAIRIAVTGCLLASFLLGLAVMSSVFAASPIKQSPLTVSPTSVAIGQLATWTVTETPSTTVHGAQFYFDFSGPNSIASMSCAPAANCVPDASTGSAIYNFATLSKATKLTIKMRLKVEADVTGSVSGNSGCSGQCPARATLKGPIVSITVSDNLGPVVPTGKTVQFTVTLNATAGPTSGVAVAQLPDGLADPTGISAGGTWSATNRHIEWPMSVAMGLTRLRYSAVITAANGSKLTTKAFDTFRCSKCSMSMTIKVGTPPKPTPKPTPRPTPKSTTQPTPRPTSKPIATSASSAMDGPSQAAPSVIPSATESGGQAPDASSRSDATPSAVAIAVPPSGSIVAHAGPQSNEGLVSASTLLPLLLLGGLAVLASGAWAVRARRRR